MICDQGRIVMVVVVVEGLWRGNREEDARRQTRSLIHSDSHSQRPSTARQRCCLLQLQVVVRFPSGTACLLNHQRDYQKSMCFCRKVVFSSSILYRARISSIIDPFLRVKRNLKERKGRCSEINMIQM